jgi:hypothetical protein
MTPDTDERWTTLQLPDASTLRARKRVYGRGIWPHRRRGYGASI